MCDEHPTVEQSAKWEDVEALAAQTAYQIANHAMRGWPFPHLEIEDLLPRPFFEALRSVDVSGAIVSRRSMIAAPPPRSHPARFSRTLTDAQGAPDTDNNPILSMVVATLGHLLMTSMMIARFRPLIEQRFGGAVPKTVPHIEYIDDRTGYELLPHTDVPQKLVTLLLYLADDGADPGLGTALYDIRQGRRMSADKPTSRNYSREDTVEVRRVPYRPNRARLFAPSTKSLHGVPPVENPTHPRRLLQYQLNVVLQNPKPAEERS